MNIEMKSVSDLGREMFVTVDKDEVTKEKTAVVNEIGREAVVEGFRKGRAPQHILEARFADMIREKLLQRVIPRAYINGVKEQGLTPVVDPEVSDVKLEEGVLTFRAYLEIRPEVEIAKYTGFSVKKVAPEEVTDEKVEGVLREWEKKPEFAVSLIDPEKRRAWKQKIKDQLEHMAGSEAAAKEEGQLWEQVMQQARFPVPERMVAGRARRYAEDHLRRLNLQGKKQEELDTLAHDVFEKMKPLAEHDIRKYFILDKVAELEKIVPEDGEVEERVTRISRIAGEPVEQLRKKLEEAGKLEDIRDEIRLDKALQFLKQNVQWIERVILPGEPEGRRK